jgi:hypothetical protein
MEYIDCGTNCQGCEWCSDAYGVDAIKDANVEMGLDPYNRAGYYEARRRGWLRSPYPKDE